MMEPCMKMGNKLANVVIAREQICDEWDEATQSLETDGFAKCLPACLNCAHAYRQPSCCRRRFSS